MSMYRTPSFGSQRDTKNASSGGKSGDYNNNSNSQSKLHEPSLTYSSRSSNNTKLDRSGSLSSVRSRDGSSSVSSSESPPPSYTPKSYIPLTQRGMLFRTNSKENDNTTSLTRNTPVSSHSSSIRSYTSASEIKSGSGPASSTGPMKAFKSSYSETGLGSISQQRHGRNLGSRTTGQTSGSSGDITNEEKSDKNLILNGDITNRRDVRDQFLRGENAPTPKFDPSHQRERTREKDSYEREKDKDKEKVVTNGGGRGMTGHNRTTKETDGYVGFANLPNQVYRKSVKKGFEFTFMVVGESGLGKSTLINSMFLTDLYSAEYPGPSQRIKKTVQVETTQVVLKEGGVQLRLTVVDTPGFGDAVDNSNCWTPIINHIESQYDAYLNAESRVNRKVLPDQRVHCCLYFISPNGHGLKPLDVEFMRRLHDKVNIIPLIAKADTMTPDECREFKKTILNEIAQHKIKIYEFPDCEDEEEARLQKKLKDRVPFAVVGSNTVVDANGKKVRGRVYPWGVVEVENLEHNDFIALRNMLIRTHMQDLKDVTNNVHYENFRYNTLSSVTQSPDGSKNKNVSGKSPLIQMEDEKKDHVSKMKKMEAEMEQVFELKVKEKMQKLKDSEADLQRRAEQMKKSLEQQEKEVEERWKHFEKQKMVWDEEEEERRRSTDNLSINSFGFMSGNPNMGASLRSTNSLPSSTEGLFKGLRSPNVNRTLKKEKKKGLF